jgi:hypothetical protein
VLNCLIRKPPQRTIPTWRSDIGRQRAVRSTSESDARHGNGQGYFPIARSGTENGRVGAVRHGMMERWLGRSLSSSRVARASSFQFSSGSHSSADLQSLHARKHSHLAVSLSFRAVCAILITKCGCYGFGKVRDRRCYGLGMRCMSRKWDRSLPTLIAQNVTRGSLLDADPGSRSDAD